MPTGEIQPAAIKIDRIVDRIKEGDIKIPAFQRGFVWDQEQIIELLDSIYNNYPIGSILLWSSLERLKSSRNIGGLKLPSREPAYPVNYVLDGQQRLSSIFAVFCGQREYEPASNGYTPDPNLFELSFRFADEKFIPTPDADGASPSIRLSSLLETEAFFGAIENLPRETHSAAKQLFSRINNYEIPVVTISRRSKAEVGVIFERINSTGTTLTTLDLLVAWTWSEDFHLQEAINELTETLEAKGFGDIPDKVILQALGAVLLSDTRTKTVLSLNPDDVRRSFERVGQSIAAAVDFLSTDCGVQSLDLLPQTQQIVPLSHFFGKQEHPTAAQIQALRKWFWKTAFSRRYSAQTDDKMNNDIAFMDKVLSGDNSGLKDYSHDITRDDLIRQKFTKSHPYARALLLLMAQKIPLNLTNGAKIDLGEALSAFNRKEYHHIFPRASLRTRGVSTDRINSLCNFCFLPSVANKKISQRKPSDYIFTLVPDEHRKEILESNLMPLRMEVYKKDNYDEFLNLRAELICQFLDALVI